MPPAETARAAERFRREQVFLAAVLTRDLVRLFRGLFSVVQPDRSWPQVRTAVGLLVRDRRAASASAAASYYGRVRAVSGVAALTEPPGGARPHAAVISSSSDLVGERLDRAVDGAGIATFKRSLNAGSTPGRALDRASVALSGAATRLVLEGGREVIRDSVQEDPEALGWARITDADPCSWCAMLASRGAVYKGKRTAGRGRNAQFAGEGSFKWHDHCGCQAIPVFDADDPNLLRSEDLYDQWLTATQGTSGKDALNAWRRYWDGRHGEASPIDTAAAG